MTRKFLANIKSITAARKACPWATQFVKDTRGIWCFANSDAYYAWLDAGRPAA